MKAKKVFQTCLVLCGLLLSFCGITSLVVATLLDHDSDLKMTREARSRTYGTQYWLGIPLIAFGGLLMLISPSLHKRKKMAVFNVCVCIPLLTCCLVGTVLHGTAYIFFLAVHQNRLFVEDYDYTCSDDVTHESTVCQCTRGPNLSASSNIEFPVPCDQQKSLVGFHGVLFSLSAIAFALLLGILVICIIFLLNFFKLQLAISTNASGQENQAFSQGGARRPSRIGLHIDLPSSQYPSETSLYSPDERPPSYESLITSFGVTSPPVRNDVTNGRGRQATVNRQARVRYRGQLSSRFNPGTNRQDSLSNEVFNSDENDHENEAQATANQVDGGLISVQRSQGDTVNNALNNANQSNSENGRVIIAESRSPTHSRHEPTASARLVQSSVEAVIETHRSIRDSSLEYSNESAAGEGSNSGLTPHRPLERTVSSNSETNVYIDITRNLAHNPVTSPSDPALVAVRHRGQLDSNSVNSIQKRSTINRGQEGTTDEDVININLQAGTSEQTTSHLHDSSNVIYPQVSTEPISDSSNNTDTTNTDTGSHTELETISTQLDNESIPSESNDVNTLNLNSPPRRQRFEDTNSQTSLEILSI